MSSRSLSLALLLALAALPFLVKALTVWAGVSGYGLQSAYKLFQLAGPILWFWWMGKKGWKAFWPLESGRPSPGLLCVAAILGLVAGGIAIIVVQVALPFFAIDPAHIRAGMDARFSMGPTGAVAVVLFLALVNSALEEFHFRLWLDRALSARMGKPAGIALSALAFGFMHVFIFAGAVDLALPVLLLVALAIAAMGVVWSVLVRKSGGFYAAWLSHGIVDAVLLGWGLHWLGYI